MKSRMKNVAMVMPDALQTLLAFGKNGRERQRAGENDSAGAACARARSTVAASASTCTISS